MIAALYAHRRAMQKLFGPREAPDNAHIGNSIIWYVSPRSPNADMIRLDAIKRGLRYNVPWLGVNEVVVSAEA